MSANHYDVVIVGGAMIGSSIAWWLSANPDFDGTIAVVERDPTYMHASTSHTNSCMRQQFSHPLNIQISQFAAEFVRNFPAYMGEAAEAPELAVNHYGYMYLADTDAFADQLRQRQVRQAEFGVGTTIMSPSEIKATYPFYNVDDIVCGSHNLVDEGYFDGGTMFDQWRKRARANGVSYLGDEVVGIEVAEHAVTGVKLKSGDVLGCRELINAAGPRAELVSAMAGIELRVEPRKRFTFIFDCAEDLGMDLPLTIDPSGVHVRSEGGAFMTGCPPDDDVRVDPDDFEMDRDIFEDKVWPALVHRIPAFERIKVQTQWAGHYAHHDFDHNVVVGRHPDVKNFVFANGFSGHGLQQSPAIGRGVSELVAYGEYRSLDLSPLGYERIVADRPFVETAII